MEKKTVVTINHVKSAPDSLKREIEASTILDNYKSALLDDVLQKD